MLLPLFLFPVLAKTE